MALSLLAPTTTSFTTYPWVPKRGAEWEAKPWSSNEISDQAGLETLAKKLNPVVGYYDPFNVGEVSKEVRDWLASPSSFEV